MLDISEQLQYVKTLGLEDLEDSLHGNNRRFVAAVGLR